MTALYAAHAVGLIRLGFIMLGDRGAAEDVVQDAFLGLYRNWDRLNDPANALTYVRSSVLNGCRAAAAPVEPDVNHPASNADADRLLRPTALRASCCYHNRQHVDVSLVSLERHQTHIHVGPLVPVLLRFLVRRRCPE